MATADEQRQMAEGLETAGVSQSDWNATAADQRESKFGTQINDALKSIRNQLKTEHTDKGGTAGAERISQLQRDMDNLRTVRLNYSQTLSPPPKDSQARTTQNRAQQTKNSEAVVVWQKGAQPKPQQAEKKAEEKKKEKSNDAVPADVDSVKQAAREAAQEQHSELGALQALWDDLDKSKALNEIQAEQQEKIIGAIDKLLQGYGVSREDKTLDSAGTKPPEQAPTSNKLQVKDKSAKDDSSSKDEAMEPYKPK